MKLRKNTVIDLWSALGDIPTAIGSDNATVIDEPFMGWPAGTDVEEIWHFFDEQAADFGGVHALMYEAPSPERRFTVDTPVGVIEVYAKHDTDSPEDYPGVYVDMRYNRSQLAGQEIGDLLACVEYDSGNGIMQTTVHRPWNEEPTYIEKYECEESSLDPTARKRYEQFKIQWMLDHGLTIKDISKLVEEYVVNAELGSESEKLEPLSSIITGNSFSEYLEEQGFHGMLWPCYEEWLENEGAMTYGEFMREYGDEIKILDAFDTHGNQIFERENSFIPESATIVEWHRFGNAFEITVDLGGRKAGE